MSNSWGDAGDQKDMNVAMIGYLSKEIETQTNAMVTWRSRMNFTAYFGPWIVVGGYLSLTDRSPYLPTENWKLVVSAACCVVLAVTYDRIGYCAARVEEHVWNQCNHWRHLIASLQAPDGKRPTACELNFDHQTRRMYRWVYWLMLAAFACSGTILELMTR